MRIKSSAIVPAPASHKLLLGLKLLNVALFITNILVLCNDVASNPGPIDVTQWDLSSLEGSFSSPVEYSPSTTGTSFLSETDESHYSSSYFDLGLGENGLRIGHWNVDYLTTTKFEQIKLFLLGNMHSGRSQLDALFISETFLKPDDPDTCYAIPGFIIHRRDRKKNGGGIMPLISRDLSAKRRNDLESAEVEAIWLEVCPYKSK